VTWWRTFWAWLWPTEDPDLCVGCGHATDAHITFMAKSGVESIVCLACMRCRTENGRRVG